MTHEGEGKILEKGLMGMSGDLSLVRKNHQAESSCLDKYNRRREELPIDSLIVTDRDGRLCWNEEALMSEEERALIAKALGWRDFNTAVVWFLDLVNSQVSSKTSDETTIERALAIYQRLVCLQPQNEEEAMLVGQIVLLERQALAWMRLSRYGSPEKDRVYVNAVSKLFNRQQQALDLLNKMRRGGEQRVVVQHVQVNQGGQAVVGQFEGGRGGKKLGIRDQ